MTIVVNTSSSFGQLSTIHNFSVETGDIRESELATDGLYLYGVRSDGGANSHGSVFRTNLDGSGMVILHEFVDDVNGVGPYAAVTLAGDVLYGMTNFGGINDQGTVFSLKKDGSGFTKLMDFGPGKGALPHGRLIVSNDVIYGTCAQGDANIFRMNIDGSGYSIIKEFTGLIGNYPTGPLLLVDTLLYGVTYRGGTNDNGTIYRVDVDGTDFEILHQFDGINSYHPVAGLVEKGTTLYGITSASLIGGTIFSIEKDGTDFATIQRFDAGGPTPSGKLSVMGDNLYGMLHGLYGAIFRLELNNNNNFELVHGFNGNGGRDPYGSLMEYDGKFYGYVPGGTYDYGILFSLNTDGTSFEKMMDFTGTNQGNNPEGGLALANYSMYGVASTGGLYNHGVVYKMTNDGSNYTVLHHFNGADGKMPLGSLTLIEDRLYGTSLLGGMHEAGTLYTIDTAGTNFEVLSHFGNSNGISPTGKVISDGDFLYGVIGGGLYAKGILYKFNRITKAMSPVYQFDEDEDLYPLGSLIVKDDLLIGLAIKQSGENILYSVQKDGSEFRVILERGVADAGRNGGAIGILADTLFVAALQGGGALDMGTLYRVNVDGTGFKKLKNFDWQVGGAPTGELLVSDSLIYGMLANGGPNNGGVVYQITPDGAGYDFLVHFDGPGGASGSISTDGSYIYAAITQRPNQVPYSSVIKYDLSFAPQLPVEEDPEEESPIEVPDDEGPEEETPDGPVTSVEDQWHESIHVYPNPTENYLTVVAGERHVGGMVLLDSMGRKVSGVNANGEMIDVSGLPSGIYTISIGKSRVRFLKK